MANPNAWEFMREHIMVNASNEALCSQKWGDTGAPCCIHRYHREETMPNGERLVTEWMQHGPNPEHRLALLEGERIDYQRVREWVERIHEFEWPRKGAPAEAR